MVTDEKTEVTDCAERIRRIRLALFGSTPGNKYRHQVRELRGEAGDGLQQAARNTRAVLMDHIFDDSTIAPLALAQMTRQGEHAGVIFVALDLANLCLMNPEMHAGSVHRQWVEDIGRTYDDPVALVFQCLKWLTH